MPTGLFKRQGGFRPLGIGLSETKPASVIKAPEGVTRYGVLNVGTRKFVVAIGGDALYVDANGDGDLTNDPKPVWEQQPASPEGKTSRAGTFRIALPIQGKSVDCEFGVYETGFGESLGAYADFALEGKVTLGGKSYSVVYADPTANWDGTQGDLLIDKDGDGKINSRYEMYPVSKPFNIGGTTYELRSEMGKPSIVESDKTVEERTKENTMPRDPNLGNGLVPGKLALPFEATTLSGQKISFPNSYKGKIVLVDFWATWCGPCMAEVPNVVRVYKKYHERGFDVLGVSLDREKAEEQIKKVTTARHMPWEQIYDGKFWDAQIAKQYSVRSIPAVYVVDGDTGKILAAGYEARGEKLEPVIEKALAAKKAVAGITRG